MIVFRWIFRLIKAILFGAICGLAGFMGGAIVFGILQLFCGWSKASTDAIIWICAILFGIWGAVTIIRNGVEDDADDRMLDSYNVQVS